MRLLKFLVLFVIIISQEIIQLTENYWRNSKNKIEVFNSPKLEEEKELQHRHFISLNPVVFLNLSKSFFSSISSCSSKRIHSKTQFQYKCHILLMIVYWWNIYFIISHNLKYINYRQNHHFNKDGSWKK
jgi:hypothetical protein